MVPIIKLIIFIKLYIFLVRKKGLGLQNNFFIFGRMNLLSLNL